MLPTFNYIHVGSLFFGTKHVDSKRRFIGPALTFFRKAGLMSLVSRSGDVNVIGEAVF